MTQLDPFELLTELEHLEHEALRTQDPTHKFVLLQSRLEVLELLVALKALSDFQCERLDRIIATEPVIKQLYDSYTDDQYELSNLARGPRGLRQLEEDQRDWL